MEKILKIKMEVRGLENRVKTVDEKEVKYTQLQTFEMKNDKLIKHTVKLNKSLSDQEKESLMNACIEIGEEHTLKEYQIDQWTKTYSCDGFNILKEELDTPFEVQRTIVFKVDNIQEKEDCYVFQTLEQVDFSIRIFDVKVKNKDIDPNNYKNKVVIFNDIQESKFNGKTYYSTQTTPTNVKKS